MSMNLALLLLLSSGRLFGGEAFIQAKLLTPSVQEYEKAEWSIRIGEKFKNPYDADEVALDMVLTSPSGKPILLPCYYDTLEGEATFWRARFAAQEAGVYKYFFRISVRERISESGAGVFTSFPSNRPGFLHKNNLWTFVFDNGKPFRGVGENIGWESRSFEEPKWTYDYLLPRLAACGGNFFRTWMCSWNLPLEWKHVGPTRRYSNSSAYFNPGGIIRMDQLVELCDSLGLYFMLTIEPHGDLIPDGDWRINNYNSANGGPAATPTAFFTSLAARRQYKNKLRYLIARWGYSTSIAAWEFFNEIDNAAFTRQDSVRIPHDVVTQWHMEMSRYLKEIDPYGHLVTTSISHRDIEGLNSVAAIDFNQKHIYKHTEKIPPIYAPYIEAFGKPYVIGEFGYRWEDDDSTYGKEFDYDFKRGLWYGLFSPTPILPMSWWWELFDRRNMTPSITNVRRVSEKMLAAGGGSFEQFPVVSGLLEGHGVRCGERYYIYLLNNTDTTVTASVSFRSAGGANPRFFEMNPETGTIDTIRGVTVDAGRMTGSIRLAAKESTVVLAGK